MSEISVSISRSSSSFVMVNVRDRVSSGFSVLVVKLFVGSFGLVGVVAVASEETMVAGTDVASSLARASVSEFAVAAGADAVKFASGSVSGACPASSSLSDKSSGAAVAAISFFDFFFLDFFFMVAGAAGSFAGRLSLKFLVFSAIVINNGRKQ